MSEGRVFCAQLGKYVSARHSRRLRKAERERYAAEQAVLATKKAQVAAKKHQSHNSSSSHSTSDSDATDDLFDDPPPRTDSDVSYFDDSHVPFDDYQILLENAPAVHAALHEDGSSDSDGTSSSTLDEDEELLYDLDSQDDIHVTSDIDEPAPFEAEIDDECQLDSFNGKRVAIIDRSVGIARLVFDEDQEGVGS